MSRRVGAWLDRHTRKVTAFLLALLFLAIAGAELLLEGLLWLIGAC